MYAMRITRAICFCLAFTGAVSCAQPTAVVTGPSASAPGDLVILDASQSQDADDLEWLLTNSSKGYLTFENDTKLVFASGQAGVYTFVLSVAGVQDGKARISSTVHTVTIGKPGPVTPDPVVPDPVIPEPIVPDPVIPDPVIPEPHLIGMALDAYNEALKIQATADERLQVAKNFRTASEKADDESWSVGQMIAELQKLNRANPISTDDAVARWTPFVKWVAAAMKGRNDRESGIEGLNWIADGLEASAEPPARISGTFSTQDRVNESLRGMVNQLRHDLQHLNREVGN